MASQCGCCHAVSVGSLDLFSVYSVLVEMAGAPEGDRAQFLHHHTSERPCDEWRFQGSLGFGGKYWRRENRVSCYPEDSTPERERIIAETTAALSSLNDIQERLTYEKRHRRKWSATGAKSPDG